MYYRNDPSEYNLGGCIFRCPFHVLSDSVSFEYFPFQTVQN